MRFDIKKMIARASKCESQSMYIECALTSVVVDYYFEEFLKVAPASSIACGNSSACSEMADVTPHPPQAVPLPLEVEGNDLKISKRHRAVEIDGCRIYFIRFDDVIAKRSFDDGGVIWDYILEEDK